jgi:hypothetical protein
MSTANNDLSITLEVKGAHDYRDIQKALARRDLCVEDEEWKYWEPGACRRIQMTFATVEEASSARNVLKRFLVD